MAYLEVKDVADGVFNFPDTRITKFLYLSAGCADEVVVLLVSVRLFEKALAGPKLMPLDQITFYQ